MKDKTSLFYQLDILSSPPKLMIYSNKNYKTSFGAILSFLALIGSLIFVLYSFLDYIKFNSPSIVYWRDSYKKMNRTFNIWESMLMFQILDSSNNIVDKKDSELVAELVNFEKGKGETSIQNVTLEPCELGININNSFTETVNEYQNIKNDSIKNYYCISSNKNITLYYEPQTGYNYLKISIILYKESEYSPSNLRTRYVVQQDSLNHFNKSNPIEHSQNTGTTSSYGTDKYTITHIPIEYLKYQSDNGIIFEKFNYYTGYLMGTVENELSSIEDYAYNYDTDHKTYGFTKIGDIRIEFSQINDYDQYQRVYPKIQSLLADVKTVVDAILVVGGIIADFISRKKMAVDIIRSVTKRKTDFDKHFLPFRQSGEYYEMFRDGKNNVTYLYDLNETKNNIKNSMMMNSAFFSVKDPQTVISIMAKNKEINLKNEKKMKKIGIYSIVKSYFCCQNVKTKLINACYESVKRYLCFDFLLYKIMTIEKMYDLLSEEDRYKINYMNIKELRDVYEYQKIMDSPNDKVNEVKISNNQHINVELTKIESEK